MSTGSQLMKTYCREKFLRQFYAQNYSKPHHKILKDLLKFIKKGNLKDHGEMRICCPTKKDLCLQTRKICTVVYSDTEQRKASSHQIFLSHIHMEIQSLFHSLALSPCPVVDLRDFGQHSRGQPLSFMGYKRPQHMAHPLPDLRGRERRRLGYFPGKDVIGKHLHERNAWPLPNSWFLYPPHFGV